MLNPRYMGRRAVASLFSLLLVAVDFSGCIAGGDGDSSGSTDDKKTSSKTSDSSASASSSSDKSAKTDTPKKASD